MLKVRVLTAATIGPLFVLGVLYLPNPFFALLVGLIILMGAWEWTRLAGYDAGRYRILALILTFGMMTVVYLYPDPLSEPLLLLACVFWLVVAGFLLVYRRIAPFSWPRLQRWISGALVLIPAWLAITLLQSSEPVWALMLVSLIWAADTGAYFAGRRWGRHKLAPAISPGKTLEGVCGALAAVAIVAVGFGAWWGLETGRWIGLVCLSIAVAVMSIFGDLLESNWKRLAKLKDSGELLPGHGGVLDRIDSMTAAAPFFTLGWLWWFDSTAA